MTTTDHTPDTAADLSVIVPHLETITIGGTCARVKRIRTRELMLLVRVITSGAGQSFHHVKLDAEDSDQQLIGLLIMAVPEAHEEFVELLQAIVEPAEPIQDSDTQKRWNQELANPEINTTMDVLAALLTQEKDTIPVLLGKAKLLVGQVQALYRTGKKDS